MKTTDKNHPVFQYLLDAIPTNEEILSGWDETTATDKDRLQFVLNTFRSEYGYNIARIGEVNAFREWLMGLPSVINVDFENYRIIEIAKQWNSIPEKATERQDQKIIDNWFNFISIKFFQLCKRNKVA